MDVCVPWSLDQVGVNAPGRPTTITFLSAMRSATLNSVGGQDAACTVVVGNLEPTAIAIDRACATFARGASERRSIIFIAERTRLQQLGVALFGLCVWMEAGG
jgi:hypothetical protein